VIAAFGAVLAVTGLWFTDDRFVPSALRERPQEASPRNT
jgi:hypothetical protein